MLPRRSERERTRTAELSCWPPSTRYGNALSVETRYICEVGWFDCSLQLFPPSRLTLAPPSLPSIIRIGSSAEIQTSWLSLWGVETRSKVLPPSSERWTHVHDPEAIDVGRIGLEARVVPGSLAELALGVDAPPRAPASSERKTPPPSDSIIA